MSDPVISTTVDARVDASTVEVPVLVIGGSLVGLATSMFLAQHGVDVLSIEKHHGTAIHPRAGYFQLRTIEMMMGYVDCLQVGARNMQNYDLLRELGKVRKPVLLKRGLSATIEEWLLSAEYILAGGNTQVVLCERGIRTFENATRNTLDLSAIPVVKKRSHLPIVVDPSHGTGRRDKVIPMARAAVAAGADGLLIEVHNNPEKALSDGAQSLYPEQFDKLMGELRIIAPVLGRTLPLAKLPAGS